MKKTQLKDTHKAQTKNPPIKKEQVTEKRHLSDASTFVCAVCHYKKPRTHHSLKFTKPTLSNNTFHP